MTCFIRKVGEGPPLVLIHGFGFNHTIWSARIVSHCQSSYTCYLIDLPGFGESDFHCYSLSDLVEILLSQLPARFTLCGWSLGGLIGIKMALEHPERVKQLLTLSTDPGFGEEGVGLNHKEMSAFHQSLISDKEKAMKRFLHLQFSKKGFDKKLYRSLFVLMQPLPSSEVLSWGIALLSETRLGDQLEQLKVPSVFLYGDEDKIVSPKTCAKIASLKQPNVQSILIEKAGHALVKIHDDIVIKHIEEMK